MINYLTPSQATKGIQECCEKIEYMKILYHNQASSNEQSIINYEKDIKNLKWSIIDYLSNNNNYREWKNSESNNAALLFKYFEKKHFEHEINDALKVKFLTEIKPIFDITNKEFLLTNREKQTLKYFVDNEVKLENQYQYLAEEQLILNLYDKELCFKKNFNLLLDNLPENKKLTKEGQKAINLIKESPLLLADNPHHFIINRDRENFPTVTCEKLSYLLLDSTVGDKPAIETLKSIVATLDKLQAKESQKENIKTLRINATITNINTIVNKIN